MSPKRIQMSRQHPWRAENPDAVIVARPSKWGNPYKVGETVTVWVSGTPVQQVWTIDPRTAVTLYRVLWWTNWNVLDIQPHPTPRDLDELRGRDLACWCPLDQPCHADVLLELANREVMSHA